MIITTKYEYGFTHSMASRKRNGLMIADTAAVPLREGGCAGYFIISEST